MRGNLNILRVGAFVLGAVMAVAPVTAASAALKSADHAKAKHHKAKPQKATHKSAKKSTSASTANFNSCSVVTQAEAASALGSSVTPGVIGNATVEGGLACVFYGPSAPTPTTPNAAQPDSVRVVVVKGSDAVTWYDNYKSSPEVHAQPITGYGDQAFYDGVASFSVLKGDYYLRIAVIPAGAAPSLPHEEQLANAILPKL
jgi:hypothetical protein